MCLASLPGGQEREQVLVVDILLAVGEPGEPAVCVLKLRRFERKPEFFEAAGERVPARVLAEDDAVRRHADRLWRHDLVAERIREHAVLVYSGLVRKGVAPHDGLIRLYPEADDLG